MSELETWLDAQIEHLVALEDRLAGNNSEFNCEVIEGVFTESVREVRTRVIARASEVIAPLCDRVLEGGPSATLFRAALAATEKAQRDDAERRLLSALSDVDASIQSNILDDVVEERGRGRVSRAASPSRDREQDARGPPGGLQRSRPVVAVWSTARPRRG